MLAACLVNFYLARAFTLPPDLGWSAAAAGLRQSLLEGYAPVPMPSELLRASWDRAGILGRTKSLAGVLGQEADLAVRGGC